MTQPATERSASTVYRVLARKYRPASFSDLIGQEALVRTLTNAIDAGRLAHAFILTGVRGVGKTTTARILARALNCVGPDGDGGPTIAPCGVCEHCQAIAQDRHVDVIEMDAASRTGVDDIRELIESVRYRPVQARYKVYIIDEVHMLSKPAFNALLKTLEEPPERIVFIFATTEIRKVPVTVLSRCQRFDLRRVEQEMLAGHFAGICEKEEVTAEAPAIAMIARAADGSVRDGLSLLDQAIALGGGKEVTEAAVSDMLGLADRTRILDLFDALMQGEAAAALEILGSLYRGGSDPAVVLEDLLELTHLLTRAKLVPESLTDQPEAERERGGAMAARLGMADLARCWQVLLKGLGELRVAPHPLQAAEMVLIRLMHVSRLPSPADLVKKLDGQSQDGATAASGAGPGVASGSGGGPGGPARSFAAVAGGRGAGSAGGEALSRAPTRDEEDEEDEAALRSAHHAEGPGTALPQDFAQVVALARAERAMSLANHLERDVHLVRFERGRIEFRPGAQAPAQLASDLTKFLNAHCAERWVVTLASSGGETTLASKAAAAEAAKREQAMAHPLVQAALEAFPGATLVARREKPAEAATIAAPPQDETT
ncbi:MAG TPA: DNA polymerase III subunit gamma/tau, partial [Kiloniellaceae bacterium]|nr:DNA polymerase III subunit gamma/tau [Kiloniellaceae bacterium]